MVLRFPPTYFPLFPLSFVFTHTHHITSPHRQGFPALTRRRRRAGGRWLLSIEIPPTYPLAPPKLAFRTEIVHANVALRGGEICLDLLKDAWTPTYSVLECVRAVRMLLAYPGVDSPLNVDVAALIRAGDTLAARRLTEYWCTLDRGRYEGP